MNAQEEGSPILTTLFGCMALAIVPALLLAGIVFAGYKYFETKDSASTEEKLAQREKRRAYQEHLRATGDTAFSKQETREVRRQLSRMASEDEATRSQAWATLADFQTKKPDATRELMIAEYKNSTNLYLVAQVTWGLCTLHSVEGKQAVIDKVTASAQDQALLEAIAAGVNALKTEDRNAVRARVMTAMVEAGSPHLKVFMPPVENASPQP